MKYCDDAFILQKNMVKINGKFNFQDFDPGIKFPPEHRERFFIVVVFPNSTNLSELKILLPHLRTAL